MVSYKTFSNGKLQEPPLPLAQPVPLITSDNKTTKHNTTTQQQHNYTKHIIRAVIKFKKCITYVQLWTAAKCVKRWDNLRFIQDERTQMRLIVMYGKDKAIPLQTWTGPESSRRLRLPDFQTTGTWRWQDRQPYAPAALYIPWNISDTRFF